MSCGDDRVDNGLSYVTFVGVFGGRQMLKCTCALIAGLVAATPASAQYAPIWQGVYVGANLGGANGKSEMVSLTSGRIQDASFSSGIGSVFGGYNWQVGSLVAGAEVDYTRGQDKIGGFPTARGRVGWAFNNTLLYVTAGAGIQGATVTRLATNEKVSNRFSGLVVGGGIETKLARNFGLRGEVLYFDSSKEQFNFAPGGGFGPSSTTLSFDKIIYRVGLSYHFN
jgi:outer membrane immunogenic protein